MDSVRHLRHQSASPAFAVALTGHVEARLRAGLARALERWEARSGFTFRHDADGTFTLATNAASASLVIHGGGY